LRVVLQRTKQARVKVGGRTVGEIEKGFLLLVGITHEDTEEDAEYIARKVSGLRIFDDENGKMNLSLAEVGGSILSVSQFTLYGDTRRGKRPSFSAAAKPDHAIRLYEYFNRKLEEFGCRVETGVFGAMMEVELINDGPVTLILESPLA
jgi:D-tyrosyl-tRNA(Tyr) deacylase